jgi:hypothetical protein
MIRHFIGSALIAYAAVLTPSFSDAGQSAQLMAGDPSGPNVAFSFGGKGIEGLRIITHQVGNLGAKLSIWIDRSRERLFSRILTTEDRRYGDDGARCQLIFPRTGSDHSHFIVAFRRGRTAHVEVQNAAVMHMSQDLSLAGFARKLGTGS